MFTAVDLLTHFQKNKNSFTNRGGISFEMVTEDYFLVSAPVFISQAKEFSLQMRLEIKHYGLYSLINDYHISSLQFLKQKLNLGNLYDLYYSGGRGQLIITMTGNLDYSLGGPLEIYFEHLPEKMDKTKIYIPYLNYYEELEEGFYENPQYFEYLLKHHHLFRWLYSNKSNMEVCKNLGRDECMN